MPHTVRWAGRAVIPVSRVTNVVNVGVRKYSRNGSSTRNSDPDRVGIRSVGGDSRQRVRRQPVGLVNSVRLCGLRILVDQAGEDRASSDPGGVELNGLW